MTGKLGSRDHIHQALEDIHNAIAGQWVDDQFAILCDELNKTKGRQWFSVKHFLPPDTKPVWVCGYRGRVTIAQCLDVPTCFRTVKSRTLGRYYFRSMSTGSALAQVTHWMELEKPPSPLRQKRS